MPEFWDVYDRDRNKTGRTAIRGEKLAHGDFHLVVHVWILNSKGEYLIQKRAPHVKGSPNLWATTGGAAIMGDDSAAACIRETKEELGIVPDMENAEVAFTVVRDESISDVWLIRQNVDIAECVLQVEEVSAVKWATAEEILSMASRGEFVHYRYLQELFTATMPA
ncbi:NUDIX hydrolase [Neobacillus piezotolerans]|uniref:NUDIX hydrolase n=1 Tax=Neobacillus piezotolerans TaxID=2259171 RepID=A0A3D8GQZ9_9BACI|nr:NUDIX domain-containing protein [Neobacillus piezotolerans]RDU36712.1 NUDIX hydrolase [Neobacillus piezotolerans]